MFRPAWKNNQDNDGFTPSPAAKKGPDRTTAEREDGGCTVCRVNCRLACRSERTPVWLHANVTARHEE